MRLAIVEIGGVDYLLVEVGCRPGGGGGPSKKRK